MMNKKLIVEMLKESDALAKKRSYVYEHSSEKDKSDLVELYLIAFSEYDSLVKMVLAFGYMVQRDKNDEIVGIKKVK